MSDLIVLTGCNQSACAVRGILTRPESLGIRAIESKVISHTGLDPGCLNDGHLLLRSQQSNYRHALMVFDHDGCGQEDQTSEQLRSLVQSRLDASGWLGRSDVIVITPELEAWVWGPSPNVARVIGWENRIPSLQQWLRESGWLRQGELKPADPKSALLAALRISGKRHTGALFNELAKTVSLTNCHDQQFLRLREALSSWFPRNH